VGVYVLSEHIHDQDRVLQLLTAKPDDKLTGPFRATYDNVQTVKTRGVAYIPFEYMVQVLYKYLTAREEYLLLVPAIIDAGLETVCQHLTDFLTVAVTEPSSTSL
jgi:hypothetical protein